MKNKTKLQNPRGTFDILPPTSYIWRYIQNNLSTITELFGYSPISTPIIEDSKLFARGVGESTDIVEKETYTFEDRGGDLISLRPEGTAPICRSYLQNGMHNLPQPTKVFTPQNMYMKMSNFLVGIFSIVSNKSVARFI